MKIKLLAGPLGMSEAIFGIGLCYNLTSPYESWEDVPAETQERLKKVAAKLACMGAGEDKWLRMCSFIWDVAAPRFWWVEADTFKISTVAQSQSTMRLLSMGRNFEPGDFEDREVDSFVLAKLNILLDTLRANPKDTALLLKLKSTLPESFLQRRVWHMNLAVMKNVWAQRRQHRLPQWHTVCDAFVEATPSWLREAVFHE